MELYSLYRTYRGRKALLGTGSRQSVEREFDKRQEAKRRPGVSHYFTLARGKGIGR